MVDGNDVNNMLVMSYKIHQRIIALQERLISLLKENPEETALIESTETLIDELKAVLK